MARRIRGELEERYGPEYARLLELMGRVREKLLTENRNSSYNKEILSALAEQDLPELLKNGRIADIDHLLLKLCGPGYSLAGLGMGYAFSPALAVALSTVAPADASDASGLLTTVIQLGQVVGVATFGSAFLTLAVQSGPHPMAAAISTRLRCRSRAFSPSSRRLS